MAPFKQTTVPAHLKHPGGRPSEYRPEYCEMVQEHMAKGKSLTAFAGSIKVSAFTVYEWIALVIWAVLGIAISVPFQLQDKKVAAKEAAPFQV